MAATDSLFATLLKRAAITLCVLSSLLPITARSAILPEDRMDILYHRYEGNGLVIDGPSVLVRKQFKDKVSVWGNYYIDTISGASIDLLARGSTYYEEERKEKSIGAEYLHDRTIFSLSTTNSSERDYEANSVAFGVSQEFFGDMTTLTLNYSQGNDEVRENIYENNSILDTEFRGDVKRQRFGLGVTQVLTPKLIVAFNLESVIDEGFLNNPYRTVRYIDGDSFGVQREIYPGTRNSDAFAVRAMYSWPFWRASLRAEYRTYSDSWGISASNYEIRYLHPFREQWLFEAKYRAYDQSDADFYADIFPFEDAQNFLARDKEMSQFSNASVGLGVTYDIRQNWVKFFDKTSVNLFWDFTRFEYDNFRENTPENSAAFGVGNEPLFAFDANIIRLFFSVTY